MVTSINPGTAGANALGVDQRFSRPLTTQTAREGSASVGDRVELSNLSSSSDSVRSGLSQIHQALAVGHDAQAMLLQVQAIARGEGGPDAAAQLKAALDSFSQRVQSAISGGATVVAGNDVSVQAEPSAPPVTIQGVDLTLKSDPGADDLMQVSSDASPTDLTKLGQDAQKSLEALQIAMGRLLDAARTLEAHQGFISAAQGAGGVRHDLDTDGARLMALQVRQGLDAATGSSIANVEPQSVLALFRETA